ncbi:telomerase-binding protein EST1A [Centruroides vittatus]|uniref:telomerase-binding protein EST1A n=1 Tax=Centruroides vittatus TaxID=120091 RepID=UPI00350EDC48
MAYQHSNKRHNLTNVSHKDEQNNKLEYTNRRKSGESVRSAKKEMHSSIMNHVDEKHKQTKKDNKRPEIQIYRPGMGLWNKNNQKFDNTNQKLDASLQDEDAKYNHIDKQNMNHIGLELFDKSDLDKSSPESDNSRKLKLRRPDREVYVPPKPRVVALQEVGKPDESRVIASKKLDRDFDNAIKQSEHFSSKKYSTGHKRNRSVKMGSDTTPPLRDHSKEKRSFAKSHSASLDELNDDRYNSNCNNSDSKMVNNTNSKMFHKGNFNKKGHYTGKVNLYKDEYRFDDTDESSEIHDKLKNSDKKKYSKSRSRKSYSPKSSYSSSTNLVNNHINHCEEDWDSELISVENLSTRTFSQEDFHRCNDIKDLNCEENNAGLDSNVSESSDVCDHSEMITNKKHTQSKSGSKSKGKSNQWKHESNHNVKSTISSPSNKDNPDNLIENDLSYSPRIRDWSEEVEANEKFQSLIENTQNTKSPDKLRHVRSENTSSSKNKTDSKSHKNDNKPNTLTVSNKRLSRSPKEKKPDQNIPPRFKKLNKTPKSDSLEDKTKEIKSGGIIRIPTDSFVCEESQQIPLPERNYNKCEQSCIVQKQLFDPNNPDKPVIVMKQQPVMYPPKNPNIEPFGIGGQYPIISSPQNQFGCGEIVVSAPLVQQMPPVYSYPVIQSYSPQASPPILPACYGDQLLQDNQTRRMKPLVKKNLQEIWILERDLSSLLSHGIKNADMQAIGQCRWKLQLRYENIILADPRYCAEQNVEQSLWKSVFYQVIEGLRRQMEEQPDQREEAKKTLLNAVDEGTVFYENLLEKQQETFGFNVTNYLDNVVRPQRIPDSVRLVLISVQKIFIYLGDLARYREQANGTSNYGKARSWYLQAQQLAPKNGRPYNQLAILAVYTRRKLDAVYYYMRSLAASNPFLSARESLLSLFEDARKKYEQVEKKRYEEQIIQNEEREKLRNEMEERQEVWIHPDGSSSKRTSKTEDDSSIEDYNQISTFDLNKRFVVSYLHVHGKLFTKIGMESFKETASNMLREFRSLLQRTPSPMGPLRLLQLLVINMFAVANTSLKDQSLELQCRSLFQELALQLSLAMVTLLVERTTALLKEHLASDDYPTNLISEDLAPLLPAIKIWTDWMSCQRHLWYPPPTPSDFKFGYKDDVWTAFASLLTVLRTVDISDIEMVRDSEEGYELINLPEDTTLAGFVPLLGAPEDSFFAKKPFDQERARHCLRISRIQFFGDYLCGIPIPYLEFDVENKMFISLVSNLSAENTESGQDVCYELSDDDVNKDIFDDDDDTEGKNSGLKGQEESDIQELWSRKEALRKTKAQQDRYRAKIQAVLQEHRHKRPTVLEVRPHYLIPDTNCFIDHLEGLKSVVSSTHFVLVVPIVVINELDGLARGTRESSYISAEHVRRVAQLSKEAVQFLEERFASRDSHVQAITSKGSILDTITFRSEDVSDNKGTNDDLILSCCLHYCKDKESTREEKGSVRLKREAILLTEDRNLRVKALTHNVPVRDLPEFLKWANIR